MHIPPRPDYWLPCAENDDIRPATEAEWHEWMRLPFKERCRIAIDYISGIVVSTVFLNGMEAASRYMDNPNARPVLWETMWGPAGDPYEHQQRYTSRAVALEGHARICEAIRRGHIGDEEEAP